MRWFLLGALPLLVASHNIDDDHPTPSKDRSKSGSEHYFLADVETTEYWYANAEEELNKAINKKENNARAKNIVIFVGDGMSIATVNAARIYKGQFLLNNTDHTFGDLHEGNSADIYWETFPNLGHSKTYSINYMVPDSAATATAIFSGAKTEGYTLGYDSHIRWDDASSAEVSQPLETILDWAQQAGMKTGFISNTRVTHATPGALYAKTANRNWECDSKMGDQEGIIKDIAVQLIEDSPGKDTDLVFGGGLAAFVNYDLVDPDEVERDFNYANNYWNCHRNDDRNLVDEWKLLYPNGAFLTNKTGLGDLMEAEKVFGLFTWSYMPYEDQYEPDYEVPTLEEMTRAAIDYLQNKAGDDGFFLMVEGGKIDHAHHSSHATRALSETIGMEKAVQAAHEMLGDEETLIIVTADHAHTMTIGGYTGRFSDITMEVHGDGYEADHAADHEAFNILSYGNGAGFMKMNVTDGEIVRLASPETSREYEYTQSSGIPLGSETHGGDDVGIWATGPMSHLFHGTHQQSYIAHVMAYSACIGPHANKERCTAMSKRG
eukprot:TRINITY_DN10583_c0_g2_i2.p1 TRINITY_DN10583_c0_g2~~TRINITY_DN10583_c0_g2_i2.p1  ORF type:complete len:556 (+),score=113.44 TRINITY_DN10583_c0_g2_i2:22-1668(+)